MHRNPTDTPISFSKKWQPVYAGGRYGEARKEPGNGEVSIGEMRPGPPALTGGLAQCEHSSALRVSDPFHLSFLLSQNAEFHSAPARLLFTS